MTFLIWSFIGCLLLYVLCIYRMPLLSPVVIVSTVLILNLLSFFIFVWEERIGDNAIASKLTFSSALYDDSTLFHVVVAFGSLLLAILLARAVQVSRYQIVKSRWSLDRPLLGVALAGAIFSVVHFSLIDSRLLWDNDKYLALWDGEYMGVPPILRWIINLTPFITFLSGILMAQTFASKQVLPATISSFSFAYFILFSLAANSRVTAITVLGFALAYCSFAKKWRCRVFVVSSVICFLFIITVFTGRAERSGIANIVSNMIIAVQKIDDKLPLLIFFNLFQGPIIFAEAQLFSPFYEPTYMILSFSPFPAVIDGFNKFLLDANEARLNDFTPFNTIAEVYLFGTEYWLLYLGIFFLSIWYMEKISRQIGIMLSIVFTAPLLLHINMAQQYPARNTMRMLYIAVMLAFVSSTYLRRKFQSRDAERGIADVR